MKNALIIQFFILVPIITSAQNESLLQSAIIKNKAVKIEKITKYEYTMPLQDSTKINSSFEENLEPESVEIFDQKNNVKRVEYYRDGELFTAYNYLYEDDKLAYEVEDTLYKNTFSRIVYKYLPGNAVYQTSIRNDGKFSYDIISRDCNGRTIGEYHLNENQDTTSFVQYAYDAKGNWASMVVQYHKNEIRNSKFFIYDINGKEIKNIGFDISGKLISEDIYTYIDDNTTKVKHIDYKADTIKYSTYVTFLDRFGNIYKQYFRSQYGADQWIVLNYKIEYADTSKK